MADPHQKSAPPPPEPNAPLKPELPFETLPSDKPWSRWVAEELGIAPAVDAVQSTVDNAGRWFRSHLLGMSPEDQAHFLQLGEDATTKVAEEKARQQAAWDALKKRVGSSAPAQRLGPVLAEQYGPSVTPSAQTKAVAEVLRQGITEKSDAVRKALPKAPVDLDWGALAPGFAKAPTGDPLDKGRSTVDPLKPIDWMVGAQHDWIPNTLVDLAEQSSTPAGALMNFGDVGPVLHGAGALAAKLGVGAASMAGVLPPGFFSRVERIAETVGAKGIHPNKLASLLKSGASTEEVAYRKLPEFLASKGNALVTRDELAAHLAAHPAPEIGRTVLGEPKPPMPFEEWQRRWHEAAPGEIDDATIRRGYEDYRAQILRSDLPAQPTKYESHTLPGGENYRESLTTLPPKPLDHTATQAQLKAVETKLQGLYQQAEATGGRDMAVYAAIEDAQAEGRALTRQLSQEPPGQYRAGHFTEPNVLVHARTTERALPGTTGAPPPPPYVEPAPGALAAEGWTVRVDREDPYTGTRQMTLLNPQGEWAGSRGMTRLTPEEYLHEYAVDRAKNTYHRAQIGAAAPTGPRGRFVEETQSDWNQTGKREGYRTAATDAEIAKAKAEMEAAQVAHAVAEVQIGQDLNSRDVLFLSQIAEPGDTVEQVLARVPERWGWQNHRPGGERAQALFTQQAREFFARHPDRTPVSSSWNAMNQLRQTEEAATQARRAYEQAVNTTRVPDNPFKETWPDLALKQQLLDVANRQDLHWLGFTGSKTHVDRYGTERLSWAPEGTGFRVSWEPQVGGDALGEDLGEQALARGLIENRSTYVETPEQLASVLGGSDVKADKAWKRIQAQPAGGVYLPRKEGMTSFYDQLLPRRLEKLVKPFGGTVEKGAIPITKETGLRDAPGFVVRDNYGNHRGWWPTREEAEAYIDAPPAQMASIVSRAGGASVHSATGTQMVTQTVDEPAWIAHLSPDMKERIRKQGFPLLSFLPPALIGGAAAGAAASQLSGSAGDDDGLMRGVRFGPGAPPPPPPFTPQGG